MVRRLIPAAISIALTLSGCATQKQLDVPDSVKALENQFIVHRDDSAARLGANPTYVLIEKASDKSWTIVAMSRQKIKLTRSNQEELLVSRSYSNIVPTWNWERTTYKEDPITGKRSNFVFSHDSSTKTRDYGPANSAFASVVSRTNMPTMSGLWGAANYYTLDVRTLNQVLVATNLLAETRSFNDGQKSYPTEAAAVVPLSMTDQVWKIQMSGAGEIDTYFFVPNKLKTINEEYIEKDSSLHYAVVINQYPTHRVPLADLRRIKVYSKSRNSNGSCYSALLDVGNESNVESNSCNIVGGQQPMRADSRTLGRSVPVNVEGVAYGVKHGAKGRSMTLKFDLAQVAQVWFLNASEAQAARATFR